ncbi:MAG: VanZ family protein [Nitrosomonas sp.]|nr:VanZ family protein [Nitrosomonas sp.]
MPLFRFNLLFFTLLSIATLLAHFFIERFQPTGDELLTNQWKTKISDKSRIDIGEEHIQIFSDDPKIKVSAFQFLPQTLHDQLVLFSAEIRSHDIIEGTKPWHTGRVSIMQKNDEENNPFIPLSITSLIGTNEWKKYQDHFQIPRESIILFSIELYRAIGLLEARNIHIYPVEEIQAYTWSKKIILSSWSIFFILLIGSCCFTERKNIFLQLLLIVFFALIAIGTSMQGNIKDIIFDTIDFQFNDSSSILHLLNLSSMDLSKIGHFIFFLGLGFLLAMILKDKKIVDFIAVIVMLACGTELIQIYIDGRTPLFSDALIDISGGLLGIALAKLFRYKNNQPLLH